MKYTIGTTDQVVGLNTLTQENLTTLSNFSELPLKYGDTQVGVVFEPHVGSGVLDASISWFDNTEGVQQILEHRLGSVSVAYESKHIASDSYRITGAVECFITDINIYNEH